MDNDAKSCFDRILCVIAMIVSMYYGIPLLAAIVHAKTLHDMQYKIKTALGPSNLSYKHSEITPIHGTGQGSCASPAVWVHISSTLMDIHKEKAFGFEAHSVKKNYTIKIFNQGFVDDTSLPVNGGANITALRNRLNHDAQRWSNLLYSTGGLLELSKCLYYLTTYKFDTTGHTIAYTPDHQAITLHNLSTDTHHIIDHRDVNESHKTLGCQKTLNGDINAQLTDLKTKSLKWKLTFQKSNFNRQEAWLALEMYYMPQMLYSLVATNISEQQCESLQSQVLTEALPKLGWVRTTSRDLIFGPKYYGGVGVRNLYTETYILKIESILIHINSSSSIGDLLKLNLEYIQCNYIAVPRYPI
jgi:hypothetical protein